MIQLRRFSATIQPRRDASRQPLGGGFFSGPMGHVCRSLSRSANTRKRETCTMGFFFGPKMEKSFGKLSVIKEIECEKPGRWLLLQCECGQFVRRSPRLLRSTVKRGSVPACMFCFVERSRNIGMANNRGKCSQSHKNLYDVHRQMMRRCYDPASADYPNYGARGIEVCAEWHSIAGFIEWAIGAGYCRGLTIERQDVNGDYQPQNCCWIENELQAKNTHKVRRINIDGKTLVLSEWAKVSGVGVYTIKGRLARGWDAKRAVFSPVQT